MAITYNWSVVQLTRVNGDPNYPNLIIGVQWKKTAIDDTGATAEFVGNTPLILDANATFTPFESLTEQQVLDWVKTAIGDFENHVDEKLLQQLARNSHIIDEQLPWAP